MVLLVAIGCGRSAQSNALADNDAALQEHLKKVEVAEMEHHRQTVQSQQPVNTANEERFR